MGGRWSVEARNVDDVEWAVCDYNLTFFVWVCKSIYCLYKYEVVNIGKHG
jgi:hypothetical protein